jgi:aryl sulfotransferase
MNDATINANKENSNDHATKEQENYLQLTYAILCEVREAISRNLLARLSVEGVDDITEDDLLVFCSTVAKDPEQTLVQRLGITDQVVSQSTERLILRNYLKRPDNPGDPSQRAIAPTERGGVLLAKAQKCLSADRWDEFPFRSNDIVISTPPKSGTTWMQMICALLIFQTPNLPARLQELSPWLDEESVRRTEIFAKLATQEHRRIIKTHSPLTEIPADPRVTYIVVARNPFDIAVSFHHQQVLLKANSSHEKMDGNKRQSKTARERILDWIDEMETAPKGRASFFGELLEAFSSAWERRSEPNVILVHYEDLSTDLAGEMRRLARRLDITVPENKWPRLVQAATFKQMRADAEQFQPLRPPRAQDHIKEPAAFFRRGSSGEGQALLTPADAARYHTGAAQVAAEELLAWLHRDDRADDTIRE